MSTAILFSLLSASIVVGAEDAKIPDDYQGVWKIVLAVEDDGGEYSIDDPEFAERHAVELLIVGNRIVTVRENGKSVHAYATVLSNDTELTLDLRTGSVHDKDRLPTYWNLNLSEDELTIRLAIDRYDDDPRENDEAVPSFKAIRQDR